MGTRGPAPDPNALRRDRKDDAAGWTTLPNTPRTDPAPEWPLDGSPRAREAELWAAVWRKPQSVMWTKLDLVWEIAVYVRRQVEVEQPDAATNLGALVKSLAEEYGISLTGMARHRWRLADDEVAAKRQARPTSARDRVAAADG